MEIFLYLDKKNNLPAITQINITISKNFKTIFQNIFDVNEIQNFLLPLSILWFSRLKPITYPLKTCQ